MTTHPQAAAPRTGFSGGGLYAGVARQTCDAGDFSHQTGGSAGRRLFDFGRRARFLEVMAR